MKRISLACILIFLLVTVSVTSVAAQTTMSPTANGEAPPVEPAPADDPATSRALVRVTGCGKYSPSGSPISGALLIAYNRNYREITRTTTGANGWTPACAPPSTPTTRPTLAAISTRTSPRCSPQPT